MGGDRQARHRYRELFYSLEQELRTDYGLSVIESRALVQRVADFTEHLNESYQVHGQGEHRGFGTDGGVRVRRFF